MDVPTIDATSTPVDTSGHQQSGGPDGAQDPSLDKDKLEDMLEQRRHDSFALTFRNNGDLFHYFLNCILRALFAVPQFLKALQGCMAIARLSY